MKFIFFQEVGGSGHIIHNDANSFLFISMEEGAEQCPCLPISGMVLSLTVAVFMSSQKMCCTCHVALFICNL